LLRAAIGCENGHAYSCRSSRLMDDQSFTGTAFQLVLLISRVGVARLTRNWYCRVARDRGELAGADHLTEDPAPREPWEGWVYR